MLKRALSPSSVASRIRVRAAVVAAGAGASLALGAGISAAADGGPATHEAPAKPAAAAQATTAHTTAGHTAAVAHGKAVGHPQADGEKSGHKESGHKESGHKESGHKGSGHQHGGHKESANKHSAHKSAHKGAHKADHHQGAHHKAHHKSAAHHHHKRHDQGTGGPPRAWVRPVHHYKLSAAFDQAGGLWSHKHSGQDFAVPIGSSVGAVHSGVVVKAGPGGGGDGPAYGNAIVISHGHGTYSQYAHLSRIDVNVGERVTAGEHIGLSGNTGNTTGPHLHFEIRSAPDYGSAVNPVAFLHHHHLRV